MQAMEEHPENMLEASAARVESYALMHPLQVFRSTSVGFFQRPWIPEVVLRTRNFASCKSRSHDRARRAPSARGELADYRTAWTAPGALRAMLHWYHAMPLAQPLTTPIQAPVRIVRGDADTALAADLDGLVPRLPTASHRLHHEEPHEVSALLVELLGNGKPAARR